MQGKILSTQLISGDDGKRYEYDKNDVVNLGDKDLAMLTGSQVDFVSFDERVAKSIYIINENVNVSSILSADSISSARANALWGIGLLIFGFIPYIGYFFIPNIRKIINIGLEFFSFIPYIVDKAAASKSLFKNYIIAVIISFLGVFLVFMLALIFGVSMGVLANNEDVGIGASMIAVLLLGGVIALIVAIYGYKIHAELARLSGSSLFLWAFWINVVSVILCLSVFGIFVGFAGFIIAWVLLFVAWWGFTNLDKR